MKLTDLELIKRIADIEGLKYHNIDTPNGIIGIRVMVKGTSVIVPEPYNPLTNKALLLDLIYDYDVSVCRYRDSVFIESDYTDRPHKVDVSFSDKNEFARAALECIVEVNK